MALDENGQTSALAERPLERERRSALRQRSDRERGEPVTDSTAATSVSPEVATPAAKPSNRRRVLLAVLLAATLAGGGYFAHHWWTEGRFLVSTDDAYVQGDITILAAKVSGYVAAVEIVDNQPVRAGEVIARIDDGDYRLALRASQDRLATQESAINRIGRQIEAATANVARAEGGLAAAQAEGVRTAAEFERQTQLSRSEFASRARLDQATADRDRAQASIRRAEAELAAERANVAVLEAEQTEARRVAAELRTAVARSERDLSFTLVRAPIDGVIGNRAVQVGAYVEPGTRLAALVPLGNVHVDANFKETDLAGIRPGQEVSLAVDAFADHEVRGTVESVAPASGAVFSLLPPENATGNFTKIVQRVPVRIAVADEVLRQGILRPGLSVVAEVDTRTGPAPAAR
jgi:membrane fusion protein (multidrug efflux system)